MKDYIRIPYETAREIERTISILLACKRLNRDEAQMIAPFSNSINSRRECPFDFSACLRDSCKNGCYAQIAELGEVEPQVERVRDDSLPVHLL